MHHHHSRQAVFLLITWMLFIPWMGMVAESSAGNASSPGILDFMKNRAQRQWRRVPRKVLAFYYTWYGRPERHGSWVHWGRVDPAAHEISQSTHYPAKGAYDSHDPDIIASHIDTARRHGVDGFICTWWGQSTFDDRVLPKVLDCAKTRDFNVTIYWETAPGAGEQKIARAVDDVLYVLRRYGSHPAFLTVEGHPVIFVYGRVMGQVAATEWREIMRRVEKAYPRGVLFVADGYSDGNARLFDGIHTYNICGWVQGTTATSLRPLCRRAFTDAVRTAKRHGKIACLTVIPGYDDTKIRTPGIDAKRHGGDTYRVLLDEAVAADPDWILITSWNEWHEGSEIEPSWEDGDTYVKLTAPAAARFKKTPFSAVKIPQNAGGVPARMAASLRGLFGTTPVAVLPDFTADAVLWLADTGVAVRELTWEDVVDPARFNAAELPVTVYAGYESYRQTVARTGDVDACLIKYLEDGGLLMVLPGGPFPFFYNQDREAVALTHRLGLQILGGGTQRRGPRGWETPPEGATLRFIFDTARLPGLPANALFPGEGDVRWRPCAPRGLAASDVYLPLARLDDGEGQHLGDGIAYIEHVSTPPRGGKLIYAWMRMPGVVPAHDLFHGLFQLAARRLKAKAPKIKTD